jgi:hypothetical protein
MLDRNAVEETRSVSIKKTEECLLNLVKIQTGSLERAAAAWRLASALMKLQNIQTAHYSTIIRL